MKAILEFNLPEDETEFYQAAKGSEAHILIWDVLQMIRNKLKYGNDYKDSSEALEDVRKFIYESIEVNKLAIES